MNVRSPPPHCPQPQCLWPGPEAGDRRNLGPEAGGSHFPAHGSQSGYSQYALQLLDGLCEQKGYTHQKKWAKEN